MEERERDEDVFTIIQMQSWFKGKYERYWVVNPDVVSNKEFPRFVPHDASRQPRPLNALLGHN